MAYPTAVNAVVAAPSGTLGGTTPTHRQSHDQYKAAILELSAQLDLVSVATANVQTGSTYTLVLADRWLRVERSNASANTLTVPLNSSVAFPVGSEIDVLQTGAGLTTIVATGGVTINSRGGVLGLAGQWALATLIKRATDTWLLIGDIA